MAELPDEKKTVADKLLRDALIAVWPSMWSINTAEQLDTAVDESGMGLPPSNPHLVDTKPSKDAVCLALAHSSVETASATGVIGMGRTMVWYNLAGIKCSKAEQAKYDYVFTSTTEWVSEDAAAKILARGPAFAKAVQRAGGQVQVLVFGSSKSEICCFRAFQSLGAGCLFYLGRIKTFYKSAWPFLAAGNVASYVSALKKMNYFTASEASYKALVQKNFMTYQGKYDTL